MKKTDLNTINGRFRQVRLNNRLTQDEFAKELDLTRMGVNAIEIGRYKPTLDVVITIKKRFNVSYSWMIDGSSEHIDTDILIKEIDGYKKTINDQKELIDVQKKLIAILEKS